MSVTRLPTGLSTDKKNHNLGNYIYPDPTKANVFFTDFDTYTAANFVVTTTGTGTQAITDGIGGLLLTTTSAGATDATFTQLLKENFLFTAGKQTWFKCRFKVSDATASQLVFGLQITDTTPLSVTNGVFFQKAAASTAIDFIVKKASVASTATAVTTLVDDTFIELGFYYDGKSEVAYFVNNAQYGSLPLTNLPDTQALTVSFGFQNGAAAIKTMTTDYVLAAEER